ncbi:hypothetical protein [Roseinatronobacter sp.]|uniref:hypothetical protein n=1 Tax=Roseinatronobacter sp. TaxID=1945755 RepID=UPI003F70DFDF
MTGDSRVRVTFGAGVRHGTGRMLVGHGWVANALRWNTSQSVNWECSGKQVQGSQHILSSKSSWHWTVWRWRSPSVGCETTGSVCIAEKVMGRA